MHLNTEGRVEYGDFQTSQALCREVCDSLIRMNVAPKSIVEPTCGEGSFLKAALEAFPSCKTVLGFEINKEYVRRARAIENATVECVDFFEKNWSETLFTLQEPILVLGNPPWVTNSTVGALNGGNLPLKSNHLGSGGVDAITGKSNFDISEWMLLHLLERLSGRTAAVAMLYKTSVARKVLQNAWNRRFHISQSEMYRIDSAKEFGAAVDACLLVCILKERSTSKKCSVYTDLKNPKFESEIALRDGRLIANLRAFEDSIHLLGPSNVKWRSGIKHDCSRVMELRVSDCGKLLNGLGEKLSLEPTYLFPMLKSSELMKPEIEPKKFMLVPQCAPGEETSHIQRDAPKTWAYLVAHGDLLDRRSSSIYRKRPRFSVFGVGPYSFSSWKVAVSGFYKSLNFRAVGPIKGKPVVLDDTCYFIPCDSSEDAQRLIELLSSNSAKTFFSSYIFWDAKRPITAELLNSLDISMLATELRTKLPPSFC